MGESEPGHGGGSEHRTSENAHFSTVSFGIMSDTSKLERVSISWMFLLTVRVF